MRRNAPKGVHSEFLILNSEFFTIFQAAKYCNSAAFMIQYFILYE